MRYLIGVLEREGPKDDWFLIPLLLRALTAICGEECTVSSLREMGYDHG